MDDLEVPHDLGTPQLGILPLRHRDFIPLRPKQWGKPHLKDLNVLPQLLLDLWGWSQSTEFLTPLGWPSNMVAFQPRKRDENWVWKWMNMGYIYTYIYTLTYVYIHGYIIQMVNFMGKEMINNCVLGYTIFRQNHMAKALKLFLNLFMYPATQG